MCLAGDLRFEKNYRSPVLELLQKGRRSLLDLAGRRARRGPALQQSDDRQHNSCKIYSTQPWNFEAGDVVKVRLIYEKENRYVEYEKNGQKAFRGKLERAHVYCACVAMGAEH